MGREAVALSTVRGIHWSRAAEHIAAHELRDGQPGHPERQVPGVHRCTFNAQGAEAVKVICPLYTPAGTLAEGV